MAISDAGSSANQNGGAGPGAQTLSVTIPSHSIAIVAFSMWDAAGSSLTGVTLDGVACTRIDGAADAGANDQVDVWWCTGASTGAAKTLNWTNSTAFSTPIGVGVAFLSGTDTASPIRSFNHASGSTSIAGLSFVSGDWTIGVWSSDLTINIGSNTSLIAEHLSSLYGGAAYNTAAGSITFTGGASQSIVAFTVKPAGAPTTAKIVKTWLQ